MQNGYPKIAVCFDCFEDVFDITFSNHHSRV